MEKIVAPQNFKGKIYTDTANVDFGRIFYFMALTGANSVMWTLWQCQPASLGGAQVAQYMGCLADDIQTALKNFVSRKNNEDVQLVVFAGDVPQGLRAEGKISFGKYKGKTLSEIDQFDKGYARWLAFEYVRKAERISDWLREELKNYRDNVIAVATERNREASTSQYVGTIGLRADMTLKCVECKEYQDRWTGEINFQFIFELDGNKVSAYGQKGDFEVGITYKVRATPQKHIEKVGVRFTTVNRIAKVK